MTAKPQGDAFVGREHELAFLAERARTGASSKENVVLVSGEPGVGKSRLLAEFLSRAESSGWKVLRGQAYDSEGMPAYLPFIEALQDHVRSSSVDDLRDEVGDQAGHLLSLLPDLKRKLPDLEAPPNQDSDAARYYLMEATAAFLERIAHASVSGLVISLDDLHWSDNATLLMLEHVVRRSVGLPIAFLIAYRDTDLDATRPLARTLEHFAREGVSDRLDVRRLGLEDVRDLLAALGGPGPPRILTEVIFRETEGNPFFVREVFAYLAEEGRLFDERGAWLSDLKALEIGVPQGVRLVIGRRLERLSDRCRQVLSVAAVLGSNFSFPALQALSQLTEEDLLEEVEAAESAHIIVSDAKTGLSFAHELVRQTLLSGLSTVRRQRLHFRAAEALESLHGAVSASHLTELANHYRLAGAAGNSLKAVDYLARVADASSAVFAWTEAIVHYEDALEALDFADETDDSRRCDLLLGLGEALVASGKGKRVIEDVAPRALALAEALGDPHRAFAACRIAIDSSSVPLPFWLNAAEKFIGEDKEARIRVNLSLAAVRFHEGRFAEQHALVREALSLANEVNEPNALFTSSRISLRSGVLESSDERTILAALGTQSRESMSTRNLADFLLDMILTHLQWGDRSTAEAERQALSDLAARTGHHEAIRTSLAADPVFDSFNGQLASAAGAEPGIGTFPRVWRARNAGWLGDTATVEAELAWSQGFRSFMGPVFSAFFLAVLGRSAESREALQTALQKLPPEETGGQTSYWVSTLMLETISLNGDTVAPKFIEEQPTDDRKLAKPLLVFVPRHAGRIAQSRGRVTEARRLFEEAIAFAEELGHRPELALTRLDLATLLRAHYQSERAAATKQLQLARVELAEMGMLPALRMTDRLLGRRGSSPRRGRRSPDELSERELEVLRLIADGKINREIAEILVLSLHTANAHVRNILRKCGVANRAEAASYAHARNLFAPTTESNR